jgi:hypothetical protein
VVTEIGYKYNGLWLVVLVYQLAGVSATVEYYAIGHVRRNTPLLEAWSLRFRRQGYWEPILRFKYSGFVFENTGEM